MLFTFNLPTSLKHAILRRVYEISGDAEAVRNAYNSKFSDVMDCIGMENWDYSCGYGDCFELGKELLTFRIYVSGHYTTCDEIELSIYRNSNGVEIGNIKVATLDEALEMVG